MITAQDIYTPENSSGSNEMNSVPTNDLQQSLPTDIRSERMVVNGEEEISDVVFTFTPPATEHGGAVFISSTGNLTASNVVFSENTAHEGGAVYVSAGGKFTASDATFSGNKEPQNGGAIYNDATGTVILENCSFTTESDTIVNFGTMDLRGTISLAGNLKNNGGTITAKPGTNIIFDLSNYEDEAHPEIITDMNAIQGFGITWSVNVGDNLNEGTYRLATLTDPAFLKGFQISVIAGDGHAFSEFLMLDNEVKIDNKNYRLSYDENYLSLDVTNSGTGGGDDPTPDPKPDPTPDPPVTDPTGIYADGKLLEGVSVLKKVSIGSDTKKQKYETLDVYVTGKTENITVLAGGTLTVHEDGKAKMTVVNGGTITVDGGMASDITMKDGVANLYRGEVSNFIAEAGTVTVKNAVLGDFTATDNVTINWSGDKFFFTSLNLIVTKVPAEGETSFGDASKLVNKISEKSPLSITVDKKLLKSGLGDKEIVLFKNADNFPVFTVNGSEVNLYESTGKVWSEDLAFQAELEEENGIKQLVLSGTGKAQYVKGKMDIQENVEVETRTFNDITGLTVRKGKTFKANDVQTAEGTTKITLQDNAVLELNALRKNPDAGGSNVITAGKNTKITIKNPDEDTDMNGIQKFTVGDNSSVDIQAILTGQTGNNSITLGKNMYFPKEQDGKTIYTAGAKFAGIDLKTGKNTFSVGSNSIVETKAIQNITNLKLVKGTAVVLDTAKPKELTQKFTKMTIDGIYTPSVNASTSIVLDKFTELTIIGQEYEKPVLQQATPTFNKATDTLIYAIYNDDLSVAAATKITVGSNSKFTAYGNISGISSLTLSAGSAYKKVSTDTAKIQGTTTVSLIRQEEDESQTFKIGGTTKNDTIKLNAFTKLESGAINLFGGKNTISVAAKAEMTVKGKKSDANILNVKSITLGNGGSYYLDLSTNKYLMAQAEMTVGGSISMSAMADTITIGKFAVFTVSNKISTVDNAGSIKLTVGSNATFEAGKLSDISSISVANTIDYKDKSQGNVKVTGKNTFIVERITATDANNTFSFGNSVTAAIEGSIDFLAGKDTLKTGKLSDLKIYGINFGKGTAKDNGTLSIGSQAKFVASGAVNGLTKLTAAAGDSKKGIYTHAEIGSLTGTTGNDTISLGKYSELAIQGSLDLRDAVKQDKITVADNANLSIAGDIGNGDMLAITLGKNAKLGLSSDMFDQKDTLNIKHAKDGSDKIYNIGSGDIAKAFRGFALEESDNADNGKPGEGYTTLSEVSNGWLSSAKGAGHFADESDTIWFDTTKSSASWIQAETGSLTVTFFKKTADGWDTGTKINEENPGTWDLSDEIKSLEDGVDYRVVVTLNSDKFGDEGKILSYTLA